MSDDVKPIPKWKKDPALAHLNITEEGIARWRERLKELDAKWTPERREELWRRIGL